jgi:hypothetical protein
MESCEHSPDSCRVSRFSASLFLLFSFPETVSNSHFPTATAKQQQLLIPCRLYSKRREEKRKCLFLSRHHHRHHHAAVDKNKTTTQMYNCVMVVVVAISK